MTEIRTAAVTAVATRELARKDARALAILGAGVQARSHLKALLNVRPFDHVRIYAPTEEHAQAVVDEAPETDAELSVAPSAELAVSGADVVVVATSSREPVLSREWLSIGAHVNAVGASTPTAREIDVADRRRQRAVLRQPRVAAQRGRGVPARDHRGRDSRGGARPR